MHFSLLRRTAVWMLRRVFVERKGTLYIADTLLMNSLIRYARTLEFIDEAECRKNFALSAHQENTLAWHLANSGLINLTDDDFNPKD